MNKTAIRQRAGHRCEYCRDPERHSLASFHVEHIIALQHGGNDSDANLALACPDCNFLKGPNLAALDPESGEMTRLFHPRRDVWEEHFRIDGLNVVGLTVLGRATVRLLHPNTPARHRHRAILRQLGEW